MDKVVDTKPELLLGRLIWSAFKECDYLEGKEKDEVLKELSTRRKNDNDNHKAMGYINEALHVLDFRIASLTPEKAEHQTLYDTGRGKNREQSFQQRALSITARRENGAVTPFELVVQTAADIREDRMINASDDRIRNLLDLKAQITTVAEEMGFDLSEIGQEAIDIEAFNSLDSEPRPQ